MKKLLILLFTLLTSTSMLPDVRSESMKMNFGHLNTYGSMIVQISKKYHLDPFLVAGIMQVESEGHWWATSSTDARGLLQVEPYNSDQPWRLYEPRFNIETGCKLLRWMIDRQHGDIWLAVSNYNTGPYAGWYSWDYVHKVQMARLYFRQLSYSRVKPKL